ncbi:thioredoxin fold domain-containing protein [Pedobacter sp. P351]|uniref:thioredoxin family protein n=1 Tax=Pedobacter superstes TaxID=3133441 RepID=UPI00309E8C8F
MKKIIVVLLLLSSTIIHAQGQKGVVFHQGLTWDQLKEKARKEKKFIFLDAYTTWCAPCRMMDSTVFPQKKVGEFFNRNFISVKVQFDITKNDNEEIKSWYKDAKMIKSAYAIKSYPTFLFFSPDGEYIHRIVGASAIGEEFISKSEDALNPDKQYYILKRRYEAGKKDPDFLLLLQKAAVRASDSDFIPLITNEYLKTQKNLLSEENLKLLLVATLKSNDPGFSIFQNYSIKADLFLGNGKSLQIVKDIVTTEVVIPYLRKGGTRIKMGEGFFSYSSENIEENPDWNKLTMQLNDQYPMLAEDIVIESKPMYYGWTQNWPKFSESVEHYILKNGDLADGSRLNIYAWTILSKCDDSKSINAALKWCRKAIYIQNGKDISTLNTYTNLLYKSGRKAEAIKNQEETIKMSGGVDSRLTDVLNKIKNNEKTW